MLAHCDPEQLILISFQGTYWYHSHFKNQYCDGLRGPLVVYDENDPHRDLYDVDDGKIHAGKIIVYSAEVISQSAPLLPLRIGIITFLQQLPRFRESELCHRRAIVDTQST